MSTPEAAATSETRETEHERPWGVMTGRSGLVIPLVLAGFATYLVVGNLTMAIPEGADFPGPTFFPWFLAVAAYILAALLTVHYVRHPEIPETATAPGEPAHRTYTDWVAVAWCVGGFLAFAALLEYLGWIIAAGLLFWCVARGIGSRRPLFDLSLGLVLSSLIYLAFGVGLGLTLPSGILGGGF